jgi:hypothetical protein
MSEHAHPKVAFAQRDGVARPEIELLEGTRIFSQRDFVFRTAVQVIKDSARQPAMRQPPQVRDIHHARRIELAILGGHCAVHITNYQSIPQLGFRPPSAHGNPKHARTRTVLVLARR